MTFSWPSFSEKYSSMGCGGSSLPAINEPSREAINAGGRRKSYNTGGNIFPKSARNKERMSSVEEEDENGNVRWKIWYLMACEGFTFKYFRVCRQRTDSSLWLLQNRNMNGMQNFLSKRFDQMRSDVLWCDDDVTYHNHTCDTERAMLLDINHALPSSSVKVSHESSAGWYRK